MNKYIYMSISLKKLFYNSLGGQCIPHLFSIILREHRKFYSLLERAIYSPNLISGNYTYFFTY